MKTRKSIALLLAAVCLFGCSKEGNSKAKGLVPNTAAEVVASPDFKLEHTTKSGIKCYTRQLTPEVAQTIKEKSRDSAFLEEGEKPFLLVIVHNDKIIDLTADDPGLTVEQGMEVAGWVMGKKLSEDKGMQEMLKKAGKQ